MTFFIYKASRRNVKNVPWYRHPIFKLIFALFCEVTLRKPYIIKATWLVIKKIGFSVITGLKKLFLVIKRSAQKITSKNLQSGNTFNKWYRAYPPLIYSQIKNYIITGWVAIFLMHLVRGRNFLCRKENTIKLVIGFITNHCEIKPLTEIWERSQLAYCIICCDEELETIAHHPLCNCPLLCRLRLKVVG